MRGAVRKIAIAVIVVGGVIATLPDSGASAPTSKPSDRDPVTAAVQRAQQRLHEGAGGVQLMSVGLGNDPVGDTAGDPDGRGDLTSVAVNYTTKSIVVSATTSVFDNPRDSYNWQAFALGDPNWFDPNTIGFALDTNGDDDVEFLLVYVNVGGGIVAVVVPVNSPTTFLCGAAPGFSAPGKVYRASFPPSCIGNPASVRVAALIYYETATTITEDITDFTNAATPTPPPPGRTGYWMVDRTGHVYAFGNVPYLGNAPTATATDIEPTPTGNGYWIVNDTGNVYAFGDAPFFGGAPPLAPGETITSISGTWDGGGYVLFSSRGHVFAAGDAMD